MNNIKIGDTVQVHYTGKFTENGLVFDSSEGKEPLTFKVGSGMVIHGFDNAVIGMLVGDKKTVNIPCIEAYGEHNDQMLFEFDKAQLPAELGELELGMTLDMMDNEGNRLPVVIHEIKEKNVVLDGNHPLAGKDLTFDLELISVE